MTGEWMDEGCLAGADKQVLKNGRSHLLSSMKIQRNMNVNIWYFPIRTWQPLYFLIHAWKGRSKGGTIPT